MPGDGDWGSHLVLPQNDCGFKHLWKKTLSISHFHCIIIRDLIQVLALVHHNCLKSIVYLGLTVVVFLILVFISLAVLGLRFSRQDLLGAA